MADGPPPSALASRSVGVSWLFLMLCLLVATPGLLMPMIGDSDPTRADEIRMLDLSWQSWQAMRQQVIHDDDGMLDRLMPISQGRALIQSPPGLVWAHALVFEIGQKIHGSDPLTPDQVKRLARGLSLLLAWLAMASIFWAGRSLTNHLAASLGALALGAMPWFAAAASSASGAMAATALSLLSVAFGLWAVRPLRPAPSLIRQAVGWVGCGLSLTGALLVAGPGALGDVVLPLLVLLIICPGRLGHLMGLLAALLLAILLLTPWALHLHEKSPETWRFWLDALTPLFFDAPSVRQSLELVLRRLVWLLLLFLPWTIWLLGAIVQPFSSSSKGSRTRLFLSWGWFITVALAWLFSPQAAESARRVISQTSAVSWWSAFDGGHGMKGPASWLGDSSLGIGSGVAAGVLALLVGQLFTQYADMAAQGRYAKFWRRLQWPHLAMVLAGSICLPLFFAVQPLLKQPLSQPLAWPLAVTWMVGLLILAFLSLRWIHRGYPARAMMAWAAWTMLSLAAAGPCLASGPMGRNLIAQEARLLKDLTQGNNGLFVLASPSASGSASRGGSDRQSVWGANAVPIELASLQFYIQRPILPVPLSKLNQLMHERSELFLLVSDQVEVQPPRNWTQRQSLPHCRLVLYHIQ